MSYDGDGGDYTSGEISDSSNETSTDTSESDITVSDSEVASAFSEEGSVEESGESTTSKGNIFSETPTESKGGEENSQETISMEASTETKENENTTSTETTIENSEAEVAETNNPDSIHVTCIREDLAKSVHPDTGVPYETKTVEVNGQQLEVVVPEFESKFDFILEKEECLLSRQEHNTICNERLKEEVAANPEWAKNTFDSEQLAQIKDGKGVEGYTWHHDGGQVGHMQLVDAQTHRDTRHTGGIAIWGCKSKYI